MQICTGILFTLLAAFGLLIASHRPLWNDEFYSLLFTTLGKSYKAIFLGLNETSNSPLFFILQKAQCDLFSYHAPAPWVNGHWGGVHVFDQFFLRIPSVVFMSAALAAVFYYFTRRNSWGLGLYALAVAMTSSLFWDHWTEARPYAEWFALSLFQILLLLNILESPVPSYKKSWPCLGLIHWLLALMSTISVIQIVAAGVVLGMFRRPKLLWYIPLILIPLGICGYYYLHAPQRPYFFVNGPVELISANIPKDRLFLIFLSAFVLLFQCRGKNWAAYLENKYLIFLLLMLGAFGLLLVKLKLGQAQGQQGDQVSSRYFLSLVPAGVVAIVLFSDYLVRAFPSKAWKAAAMVILAGFFIFRAHKTIQQVPKNQILPSYADNAVPSPSYQKCV